ncbi:MAG: hypothetical protein GF375_07645 [Candidatus Omnitrophica bacterium]|nr:hypothetical protein [Candidatus Omnitrophota bacterium]MBD3269840.1 hypothetical protein [Candidatus Omnitrophota bacterium]
MVENLLISLENIFKNNPFLGLFASFLAGVISSFSPCIYPLLPITVGVIGSAGVSGKLKGFKASLVFVSGIAVVYTALGVIASLLGILLSRFFINPFSYLFLSLVFFILGLSALGIINIPLFNFNFSSGERKNLFSLFILGAISGFAVIPCNFPVMGAILSLISVRQSIIYGAFALFLFSLGYGLILILLGTFAGLIQRLPKKGLWLIIIKRATAFLLLGIGLYFLIKLIRLWV